MASKSNKLTASYNGHTFTRTTARTYTHIVVACETVEAWARYTELQVVEVANFKGRDGMYKRAAMQRTWAEAKVQATYVVGQPYCQFADLLWTAEEAATAKARAACTTFAQYVAHEQARVRAYTTSNAQSSLLARAGVPVCMGWCGRPELADQLARSITTNRPYTLLAIVPVYPAAPKAKKASEMELLPTA